jgi:hypothetical protein
MLIHNRYIEAIMPLVDTHLGFRTDSDRYTNEQLTGFVVDCLLHNDSLVGNEVNLIKGKRFVTKEGWIRKLKDLGAIGILPTAFTPTDVDVRQGEKTTTVSARVPVIAKCWFRGREYVVKCIELPEGDARILVDGMANTKQAAIVQAKGKAEARALAKLHAMLTGRGDDDDIPAEVIETTATAPMIVETTLQTKPQPAPQQQELTSLSWGEEASRLAAKVNGKSAEIMDAFYILLGDCVTLDELQKEWQALQAVAKTDKPDQRVMEFLTRFKDHRKAELGAQQP